MRRTEERQVTDDVLFIGAHCDDIELGCGATISRLLRSTKYELAMFVLSSTTLAGQPMRSVAGLAKDALQDENNRRIVNAAYADGKPSSFPAMYDSLFTAVKQKVQGFTGWIFMPEPDQHQDHVTTFEIVTRAATKNATLVTYRTSAWSCPAFQANLYVPVADEDVKRKQAAVNVYRQAFYPTKPYVQPDVVESQLVVDGMAVNSRYAEAFRMYRGDLGTLKLW